MFNLSRKEKNLILRNSENYELFQMKEDVFYFINLNFLLQKAKIK